jgi:hypothetical protein
MRIEDLLILCVQDLLRQVRVARLDTKTMLQMITTRKIFRVIDWCVGAWEFDVKSLQISLWNTVIVFESQKSQNGLNFPCPGCHRNACVHGYHLC